MGTNRLSVRLGIAIAVLILGRLSVAQTRVTSSQDTFIRHAVPDEFYGFNPTMLSGNETIAADWRTDALVQFELPPAPEGQVPESAELELFNTQLEWANRGTADFGVMAIMFEWSEEEDTWNSLDADFADYGETVYDTVTFEGADEPTDVREDYFPEEWVTWDVSELVKAWYDGSIKNNGLAINGMLNYGDDTGAVTFPAFYTKDFDDEQFHPALVITFGGGNPLDPLDDGSLTGAQERADYVHDVLNTWVGDSNLDGEFNSGDLVEIFQAGEYEDSVESNSSWVTGDWNGDKEFSTTDLVVAFQDGGFEKGPREAVAAAVPEPTTAVLFIMGLFSLAVLRSNLAGK